MRKTFEPIDDLLIERLFQPVLDMVAHRTGLSRPAACCFCVDMASLAWIVSRVRELSDAIGKWDLGSAFVDVAILMLGLVALVCLRTLFRRAGNKQANPLRPAMQPHRAVMLLMLAARVVQLRVPTLMAAADLSMLLFAASALYLGACVERPPMRRGFALHHARVDVAVSP
jgi:hypothetical protein